MIKVKRLLYVVLVLTLISSLSFSNNAENLSEEVGSEEYTIDMTRDREFIEETSEGLNITDYEREVLYKISEMETEIEVAEATNSNILESLVADIVLEKVGSSSEIIDEEEVSVGTMLFGAGDHSSTASPSVVINSTYDRYDIYTGENAGTVRIFDNNGEYYNDNTIVKVIRDMMDTHSNSPILLNLVSDVQFFNFDNSNDNYVLLPDGFVEDLVARVSGNGYLNPQGINALDHIKVDLTFNSTDLGKYDLFEYGVLYYLSCYEGVLGEYYYYDPSTTDIDRAASFYVNNRIMDRTYSIVSEYFYKSPSGEQLSFKPSWLINNGNLLGANREEYVKQWVNFPYFLIKAGEKYWNLREAIEQSTYLAEYAEGYYEQYLTERPYGNVAERLIVLDEVYKTEESLLSDNTSAMTVHPYVKSSTIEISGNYRPDTVNAVNKLRAGGVLPYDTYAVINLNVTERRAKSVQVYLNGEKLVSNNNRGLYALNSSKCQIRIDGSKLLDEENSRNVLSFILLNEEGNYLTDAQGRVLTNYISLIRHSSISKRTHTIIFNTNGATGLPVIQVEEGNKISLPTNPSKNGFTFGGWYEDDKLTKKFNENEYITGDKRLYAAWTQIVRYSGGGSSSGGSGGGGGGGGGAAGGTIPASSMLANGMQANALPLALNQAFIGPTNAVSGTWTKVGKSKKFKDSAGNDYVDKWANIYDGTRSDWYRFDALGNVMAGFYEENSKVFYFDIGDTNIENLGKMAVG